MRSQQEVNAIISQLCSGLKPLFPQGSMEAILFGSYARGEADADSDIDVMVLVDYPCQDIAEKTWEISSVVADLLLNRSVVVRPLWKTAAIFRRRPDFCRSFRTSRGKECGTMLNTTKKQGKD